MKHRRRDGQELSTQEFAGLTFHGTWKAELCTQSRNHLVVVTLEETDRYRLHLVRRREPVGILRELVVEHDDKAIRVLGLLMTHPDPASFCDSVLMDAHMANEGVVDAERAEKIHRAMRGEAHAA